MYPCLNLVVLCDLRPSSIVFGDFEYAGGGGVIQVRDLPAPFSTAGVQKIEAVLPKKRKITEFSKFDFNFFFFSGDRDFKKNISVVVSILSYLSLEVEIIMISSATIKAQENRKQNSQFSAYGIENALKIKISKYKKSAKLLREVFNRTKYQRDLSALDKFS